MNENANQSGAMVTVAMVHRHIPVEDVEEVVFSGSIGVNHSNKDLYKM